MSDETELFDDPELVQEFVLEAEELLETLSTDLIVLEKRPEDPELLNRIFRAVHTIKGTSGFLGFNQLVELTHRTEDVLNRLRKGELKVTPDLMDVLLAAYDLIKALVGRVRDGKSGELDLGDILDRLTQVMQPGGGVEVQGPGAKGQEEAMVSLIGTEGTGEGQGAGGDGQGIEAVASIDGGAAIEGQTLAPIREDAGMSVVAEAQGAAQEGASAAPSKKSGSKAKASAKQEGAKVSRGGSVGSPVSTETITAALAAEAAQEQSEEKSSQTIRIDVSKLDELMALVGELVLERNRLLQINRQVAAGVNQEHLEESLSETAARFNYVTTELQAAVLKARMLPIEKVVRKFPRMVRDLARQTGKQAELIISGEETEVDKSVFDEIGEPLVHIIRNAIDHGVESPAEREKAGKPRCGTIRLAAEHRANHILITVSDDGRGIDVDKVAAKAVERGLVTESVVKTMDRREILEFILLPGFSTADQISNVSGRGVGMDVVRTKIKKLNGVLDISSELGKGTRMSLVLPLTLAIIQSLLIQTGEETVAVPLSSVVEVLRVDESEVSTIQRSEVLRLRDRVLPLARLDELLYGRPRSESRNNYVVIIGVAEKRFGLVVDGLVGQEEVVIKSLGEYLPSVNGVAGGTIRGDGRVRLMLDPVGLVDLVDRQKVA